MQLVLGFSKPGLGTIVLDVVWSDGLAIEEAFNLPEPPVTHVGNLLEVESGVKTNSRHRPIITFIRQANYYHHETYCKLHHKFTEGKW